MPFRYYFHPQASKDLLIYFNSLAANGLDDKFLLKDTLVENFTNYDILIVKEAFPHNWYVASILEMEKFISNLINQKFYQNIFALADSSGAIGLLNLLPNNPFFRRGVVINGQIDISEDAIYKYKDNIIDNFEISKVVGDFDEKFLKPLDQINYSNEFEILFCYNYFRSDKIHADIISHLSKSNFRLRLDFKKYDTIPCHAVYITDLLTNKNFLEEIKFYFSQYEHK